MITSVYDLRLAALSMAIAVVAFYAAWTTAGRVTAALHRLALLVPLREQMFWLLGGCGVMAIGVGSIYLMAMLAYWPLTINSDNALILLLSLLVTIIALGIVLQLVASLLKALSSDTHERLLRKLPTGVLLIGQHLEVIFCNQAALSLLGRTETELLGNKAFAADWEIVQEDGTPMKSANQPIQRVIATCQPVRDAVIGVYRPIAKNWVWLLVNAEPQFAEDGTLTQVICSFSDITQRQQAEETLRKSEHKLSQYAQRTPLALIEWNLNFEITQWNPAAERIFGYRKSEAVCSNILELLVPESVREHVDEIVESLLSQKCGQLSINENKTQDGRIIICEWYNTPLIDSNGNLIGIASLAQDVTSRQKDITERKQAQEAMVERSRLATLAAEVGVALGKGGTLPEILSSCTESLVEHLGAARACIWTVNRAANCLELQAASGFPSSNFASPNDLLLQNYELGTMKDEFIAPSASSVSPSSFVNYPLIVEERLVGVMALCSRQPFTSSVHNMLGWVKNALAVAIDRFWAREELLSRREALLFHLASSIRNSLDLNTILETTVQEIRSLLQIDRCVFIWYRAHLEPPLWEIVNEARDAALPSILGYYSTEQAAPVAQKVFNLEIIQVDDVTMLDDPAMQQFLYSRGYTSLLVLPMKTGSGEIGLVSCTQAKKYRSWSDSEIELLKAVTDQLAIAIDHAEVYTQARTAASLAQTQAQELSFTLQKLQQTQSQLIQTEKMSGLGQLVAGIAHEINNPVNFITGNLVHACDYIQDLLDLIGLYQRYYPEPAEPIEEHAEAIDVDFITTDLPKLLSSMQLGADRIREIVLSLRKFSRLDEAEMKPVDLHEGIDSTLLILRHRLKANGQNAEIEIVKEYGNLPLIECYAGQMNQVFMNILSNAIDALEELRAEEGLKAEGSNPRIRIRTAVTSANSVAVSIADNGPGISESVKARLFDPFFTTKPVGQGTGLGLSISYQIVVEKHGGVFQCLSEIGKGAEFWIEIPITQGNQS